MLMTGYPSFDPSTARLGHSVLGAATVADLCNQIADADYKIRLAAVLGLATAKSPEGITCLLRSVIYDTDELVRKNAAAALSYAKGDGTAVKMLSTKALVETDAPTRATIVKTLGAITTMASSYVDRVKVGSTLVFLLGDDDSAVRKAAESALTSLRAAGIVPDCVIKPMTCPGGAYPVPLLPYDHPTKKIDKPISAGTKIAIGVGVIAMLGAVGAMMFIITRKSVVGSAP